MKEKLNLSLICCFNNLEQLNNQLLNSYYKQNVEAELILIDNTKNKFKSAAAALNYGVTLSKNTNYIFLHQDIIFMTENSLKEIYTFILENKDKIIGVAGVLERSSEIISTIVEGHDQHRIGSDFTEAKNVFTLDECLIACSKDAFHKFDEITCDNWHLYGVDLCLSAHLKGLGVICVPSNIWHYSGGKINLGFYKSLKKLARKYRKKYNRISTTCISVSTCPLALKGNVYVREWKFKKGIINR